MKAKRATLRKTYEEQKGLLLAELLEPVTSQKLVVEEQLRGIESQVRACDENGARLRGELAKVDAAAWWRRIVGASALDAQRKKILVEQQALGAHRGELEQVGLPLQQELTGINAFSFVVSNWPLWNA